MLKKPGKQRNGNSRPKTSKILKIRSTQPQEISNMKSAKPFSNIDKLITGDDFLIEYTDRLIKVLRLINEEELGYDKTSVLDKFVTHKAWISVDLMHTVPNWLYWQRLEARIFEMKDRRRRLSKNIAKKEGIIEQFDKQYDKIIRKKALIIQKYNTSQLEIYLKKSTK